MKPDRCESDSGRHWVTLDLKNIGATELTGLDVNLNSLDSYHITVLETGNYIANLEPNEERVIPFQISANKTASPYVTADGWKDGEYLYWESPAIPVTVCAEVAE